MPADTPEQSHTMVVTLEPTTVDNVENDAKTIALMRNMGYIAIDESTREDGTIDVIFGVRDLEAE